MLLICLKTFQVFKHSKIAAAKNVLPGAYVTGTTCFDECSLDNWNTSFFIKVCCCTVVYFDHHVVAFFHASALKEVGILYANSTITV